MNREPEGLEIQRPHLLRTLETLLDGETQTVVLEGIEGIGRTTLLKQFLASNSDRTFFLAVSGASRWAYDPIQMALELASQVSQRLRQRDLTEEEQLDHRRVYGRFLTQLDRIGRREGKPFYIILDGIDDIPEQDESSRAQIVDLLPFGYDGLRFLVSGDLGRLPLTAEARRRAKPWQLIYFTREESDRYLASLSLTSEQLDAIYLATGGVPGYLASVRRRITAGTAAEEVVKSLPEDMQSSFAIEWKAVQRLDEGPLLALSALAFEPNANALSQLSEIARLGPSQLLSVLGSLQFVRVKESKLQFVSEAFRRFAADQLGQYRQQVNDRVIDTLLSDPESDDALAQLSTLYARSGRFTDVLDYLSPERFAQLYQRTPSLAVVQQKADEGIAAARALNRDGDLVRFTLQKSAIEEIASSDVGVSQVRAISSLGDFDGALAVANGVRRLELRFRLLAAIARIRKERDLPEDMELTQQIRALYHQIDPKALKEVMPSAVSDLFATAPELATELVSQVADESGENAIDWALASLSVQALARNDPESKAQAREISSKIQHPDARKLLMEAEVILGGYSARDVIQETERLQLTGDKLFLLQRWMWSNRDRSDAGDVLQHGINLALQSTGYTANAQVYRELAACLPYMDDLQAVTYYTGILDGQRADLERLGPPGDFIRLQLILARAEWRHDRTLARTRFAESYYAIGRMKDLSVRTASFARLAAALARTDKDRELEREDALHSIVAQELEDGVAELLSISASQFDTFRPVIQALAIGCPDLAIDTIAKLNTEARRDRSFVEFVQAAVGGPLPEINPDAILRAMETIVDPEWRDVAIQEIVRSSRRRSFPEAEALRLLPLLNGVKSLYRTSSRAVNAVRLVGVLSESNLKKNPAIAKAIAEFAAVGRAAWEAVDRDWEKLDLGFEIITALARSAPETAAEYVEEVNGLQRELLIADSETALAATMAIQLAMRAFQGMVHKGIGLSTDRDRVLSAITRVGSIQAQAKLIAELAIRCYLAGNKGDCEKLVQDHLLSLISSIPEENDEQRFTVIIDTCAALYIGAAATAANLLASLPKSLREEALSRVATFLLRKTSPWDPYEERDRLGFDINFEDANRIIQVLWEMYEDWRIYAVIRAIVDSATQSSFRDNFKRGQRGDLARALDALARSKFPSERFIRHEGYAIAAQAQINRLREPEEMTPLAQLTAAARRIPNLVDRSFVLAILGCTSRQSRDRHLLITEARAVAETVTLLGERIALYEQMSSMLIGIDENQSKELLKRAFELAMQGEGESIEDRRRSVVELACRLHPDVAGSFASLSDDDPAKAKIEEELRLRRITNSLAQKRPLSESLPVNVFEWSRASWMKLGSLVSGRSSPANPAKALPVLEHAAKQTLSRSYPILAWFVENAVRFNRGHEATRTNVVPLFEACLLGAELAVRTSSRYGAVLRPLEVRKDGETRDALIPGGEREIAIEFIRDWLTEAAPTQLWVIEPYFGPDSVEALALVRDVSEDCEVTVLCGRKESLEKHSGGPEDIYRQAWRRIRSDEPPPTNLIMVQTRVSRKSPVHDRWWLTEAGGLGLGTSYRGFGAKLSEIRRLLPDQASARLGQLMPYLTLTAKEYEGERVEYYSFSL